MKKKYVYTHTHTQRKVETRNWGFLRARTGVASSSYQLPVADKANLLRMAQGDPQRDKKIRSL